MVVDILQNLFAEQELCRQFLEASPDAIVVLTPQGEIIKYNNNTTEFFGYGGVSDIPHNVVQMYCDPSARGKLLSELEREGVVKDFETTCLFGCIPSVYLLGCKRDIDLEQVGAF